MYRTYDGTYIDYDEPDATEGEMTTVEVSLDEARYQELSRIARSEKVELETLLSAMLLAVRDTVDMTDVRPLYRIFESGGGDEP